MKKLLIIFALIFCAQAVYSQSIPAYKAEDISKRINAHPDTFYIVNFWATWCGPCVKEMPEFVELNNKYKGKPVKILLVSLDFPDAYPTKIEKFAKKKKLDMEMIWLNETNANEFIPKIENRWQGSIPATILRYKKKNYSNFFEGTIKAKQLSLLVDKQLAR